LSDTVSITGYGFTGSRLASRLASAGAEVCVLVRRNEQADAARAAGAKARDTRLRNLLNCTRSHLPGRIVLISTTGVYGDHGGAVVSEDTPVSPTTDRAVRRVDAENAATEFARANSIPLIILRVPGIYGPGRLPLERLRALAPLPPAADCGTTNRIHVEDLVTAIVAAASSDIEFAVFNISDGQPMNMRTWRETVADVAGLPHPPEISLAAAREQLSPMTMSFLSESRTIDSNAIREALNLELAFEDPVAGIRDSLAASAKA